MERGLGMKFMSSFPVFFNKRYSSVRLRKNECVAMAGVMEQFKEKKNFFNI